MVTPYATAATQNGNKCPHGLPVGACPICSGMGGGGGVSKNKDKPRVAGEMSYNECMAAWIKIQAAKDAKIQARIDRIEQAQTQLLQNRIMLGLDKVQKSFDKLMQNIKQLPPILNIPAKIIMNVVVKPILNIISKLPQLITNIQNFFNNVKQFISSVGEKLAMVFGEVKNFIDSKISQPIKKAIKTILSFFAENSEEEDEEKERTKLREIKKVIKNLFIRKKRKEEQELEDEN